MVRYRRRALSDFESFGFLDLEKIPQQRGFANSCLYGLNLHPRLETFNRKHIIPYFV